MKESFKDFNFRGATLQLILKCQSIVGEYQRAGYRLTLRQLYYQLVSRDIVPNTEKSYKKVGEIVSQARLAGIIDWTAIEDRNRVPRSAPEWDGIPSLMRGALNAFRLPRREGQRWYAELWVEKDALSGVLAPLAWEYHVTLCVNKGYSSSTAMYDASKRFLEAEEGGQKTALLYLGDHDPSGEDMVRDIFDRLQTFGCSEDMDVEKIALTMAQVRQYNPPPNPAKVTDSRYAAYVAKYGDRCWEVDALPPEVLNGLVGSALSRVTDKKKMAAVMAEEEIQRKKLEKVVAENFG